MNPDFMKGCDTMELLLFFAILFLVATLILKLSVGIIKFALGLVATLVIIALLPVGLVLLIPFAGIFVLLGVLKLIF